MSQRGRTHGRFFAIVSDELGDEDILLSFQDMKDWGLLSKNFPEVPKMKEAVKKISLKTKRKIMRTPKKFRDSKKNTPGMNEEVDKPDTQEEEMDKEAKEIVGYLRETFPNVFREKLRKEDRMDFNLAELSLINEDVEPWHRGWAKEGKQEGKH